MSGLGHRLVEVDVEGTAAYVAREDVDALRAARPTEAVRFLPGHDQWVMGPGTKDVHVTPQPLRDVMTRKANPVISGGVVRGTWSRKADDLTISWQTGQPRPPEAAIEKGIARLAGILGTDLQVRPTVS
jgi:hypothetical protein